MEEFYNDADDRYLAEFEEEQETAYIESHIWLNDDIQLPVLVLYGVPYYD